MEYDGISYQNAEAAFQTQKCVNAADRLSFSKLNPSEAKKLVARLACDWIGRMSRLVSCVTSSEQNFRKIQNWRKNFLQHPENTWKRETRGEIAFGAR